MRPQLCLTPESELPSLACTCITYRDGERIDLVWTRYQFSEVCWMMLNGNDYKFFLSAYQDANGDYQFRKNKLARADHRAEWAWDTITGKAKTPTGLGFYPTNLRGESQWGALDFDADSEDDKLEARRRAFAAFEVLARHSQLRLLLGTSSGSNLGWHLFCFAGCFHPIEQWIRLLEEVALRIRTPIKKGRLEIFPSSTRGRHGGGGIRAPFSWNPKNDTCGLLFLDSLTPVLKGGANQRLCAGREDISSLLCHATTREEKGQLHDKRQKTPETLAAELSEKFAITAAGTRNDQLKKLVAECYRFYGQEVVRRAALRQYESATPRPRATAEEHAKDFDSFWTFFCDLWRNELCPSERTQLDSLVTATERDGFRIIRSWAQLAEANGSSDCSISTEDLGRRLGISWQGISKMRTKFEAHQIIRKTVAAKPNRESARYQWLLSDGAKPRKRT